MQPDPSLRLVVIAPESHAPYSGMLPGFLAGHYSQDELFLDVAALTEQAGGWFIRGSLCGIDAKACQIWVRRPEALGGEVLPPITYDFASLNTGASPRDAFPNSHPHLYYVKPLTHLLAQLPAIDQALSGDATRLAIVGGGAAGIELAMAFRVRHPNAEITLISKHSLRADPALKAGARRIQAALKVRRIMWREGTVVDALEHELQLAEGGEVACDCVLVSTPVAPPDWLVRSDLPKAASGFLAVDPWLSVRGYPNLLAAGDLVELTPQRARAGVMAVRAGQYLAKRLPALLGQTPDRPFRPQARWLTLLNCGDGRAILVKGWLAAEGAWVWRLKDRIDRQFMQRFAPSPMASDGVMRCEGCAAKLPGSVLQAEFGAVFEDASVHLEHGRSRLRSLDGLSYLVADPHLMGWLAMRHALSDIWAMGGVPERALALVATTRAQNPQLEAAEFQWILNGLKSAAAHYGVTIDGGHSLALGQPMVAVSVEGSAVKPIRKTGLAAGDCLVISGPIGSGVLFAGFHQGVVPGRAIDAFLPRALQSLASAAAIAQNHGVSAMTDVTGFGLAGHLAEMCAETDLRVQWEAQIPLYDGVEQALAAGVESTATEANRLYAGAYGASAPSAVVFDPQTAGPLLVAVSPEGVEALCTAWQEAGFAPAVIARVTTETS